MGRLASPSKAALIPWYGAHGPLHDHQYDRGAVRACLGPGDGHFCMGFVVGQLRDFGRDLLSLDLYGVCRLPFSDIKSQLVT